MGVQMIDHREMIVRLVLALVLGGIIGFEREYKNRPAGLRTHILVALGSALIMLVSMYGFDGQDQARLAAQVVSGIGFLGAGTILREGNSIRGLTTAASLWVTCGIGLAAGNGYYAGAISTTLLMEFSLIILGFIENRGYISKDHRVELECIGRPGLIGDIGNCLGKYDISIKNIKMKNDENDGDDNYRFKMVLLIKLPMNASLDIAMMDLKEIKGVETLAYFGSKSSQKIQFKM